VAAKQPLQLTTGEARVRSVATTDRAMELLEEVQQDFGRAVPGRLRRGSGRGRGGPGVLGAAQGISPEAAFQQLRAQARSSSRKLADLAQEVVQDAQRQRIAALAVDDARVRAAEARAQAAERALQAAQTGQARRIAAMDRAQDTADARDRTANDFE
jgi:regulator of protease activity HflC (stomatin/prohibitin superfamily)